MDLKEKLDISCLYITHDLNTANYVSSDIIVLCLGTIVEMGKAKLVIRNPVHPYTKILINSIPDPDPRKKWKDKLEQGVVLADRFQTGQGCIFYGRCNEAKPVCREKTPPFVEIEPTHMVRCFIND